MDAELLQQTLHTEIPLTKAMGIQVQSYDGQALILGAAIEPNINHKCTAFGGSLYSLSVLCGWGLLFLKMREYQLAGHIVIQHSEIDYHQPVVSDYTACCRLSDDGRFERFIRIYQRKAKARLQLDVNIDIETGNAVSFSGVYVVHV